MVLLDELKSELASYVPEIKELAEVLNINTAKIELEELRNKAAEPGFWDDLENSQKVLQKTKAIENKIESLESLSTELDDLITLVELSIEEGSEDEAEMIAEGLEEFKKKLEGQKLATLLTGEYDGNNAIITFHAGAGGTEAQDWALLLYRMYTRFGEQHGYKVKVLDILDGDEAGIKSAEILIEGVNAYGYLKSENGVHRLVRVSPFDGSGRRHTSFASVEVIPEIEDDNTIEIREEDLRIETHRASGAGGQHVNKTDSAIRIIHLPTGIVVGCQTERSQKQNREQAMKMLKSKLIEIKERAHLEKIEDIKGDQMQIAWGSQIRSYVFMPYTLVKDHRTNYEMGNVNAVMDGDLDGFINAYLKSLK